MSEITLTLRANELYGITSMTGTRHRGKPGSQPGKRSVTLRDQLDKTFGEYVIVTLAEASASEFSDANELSVPLPDSPKKGIDLFGAWSDMTDEELAFLKGLHDENNRMFSSRLTNLFGE
jgi:hypothetical protein